jgi:hypothetical protein
MTSFTYPKNEIRKNDDAAYHFFSFASFSNLITKDE